MLSVLPRYISTWSEESLTPCFWSERSITSSVPEPRSRSTKGIAGKSWGVISSGNCKRLLEWTTATSSSSRKVVYFRLGRRKTPSTNPKSMRCSCKAASISREFPLSKDKLTCGNLPIKLPSNGGSTYCAMVVLAPNLSSPIYSLCNKCISYSSRLYSSNIRSQCSKSSRPDSVKLILLPCRSKSLV